MGGGGGGWGVGRGGGGGGGGRERGEVRRLFEAFFKILNFL